MGYTHYWYRKPETHDAKTWDAFVKDCISVRNNLDDDIELGDAHGETADAIFDNDQVCFNGRGERSHETFLLKRKNDNRSRIDQDHVFGFCKTAQKEYDVMVCACLILYKYHFGKDVQISSDGEWEDWLHAVELITTSLLNGKEIIVQVRLNDELFERCLEDAS